MKTIFISLFTIVLSCFSVGVYAGQFSENQPISIQENTPQIDFENMDAEEFLALNPRALKRATGKKLSIRERIILRQVQAQVNRKMTKGETFEISEMYQVAEDDFNGAAFALGFLLGLVGVLIAYLIDETYTRSAWIGFGVRMGVWLLLVLVQLAIGGV